MKRNYTVIVQRLFVICKFTATENSKHGVWRPVINKEKVVLTFSTPEHANRWIQSQPEDRRPEYKVRIGQLQLADRLPQVK